MLSVLLLLPTNTYAVQQMTNDNHTDTSDYCMQAHDVSIGLAEIQSYETETELQTAILDAAKPVVLLRNTDDGNASWIQLDREKFSVDFSAFAPQESTEGYPVTVTAPPIREELASAVTFRVYVEDNLPQPVFASLHFAGTELPDMAVEITNGSALV